jgi:hypothetical protein
LRPESKGGRAAPAPFALEKFLLLESPDLFRQAGGPELPFEFFVNILGRFLKSKTVRDSHLSDCLPPLSLFSPTYPRSFSPYNPRATPFISLS